MQIIQNFAAEKIQVLLNKNFGTQMLPSKNLITEMKKDFTFVNQVLGVEGVEVKNDMVTIPVANMALLDARIKADSDSITNLTTERDTVQTNLDNFTNQIDEIDATVKAVRDEAIRIDFPDAPQSKTRDILYVSGVVPSGDTLHCFVCHFPSRLGGELESEDRRMFVASVLRSKVDSLFKQNMKADIVIMGDFNDYPPNESMHGVLKALSPGDNRSANELYNLMYPIHSSGQGSHKHEGEWGALDQIIVSGNLLNPAGSIYTLPSDAHVFNADFLLVDDEKYLGKQPFRTYNGMKFQDGFADHLPVYVDLWY